VVGLWWFFGGEKHATSLKFIFEYFQNGKALLWWWREQALAYSEARTDNGHNERRSPSGMTTKLHRR